jgi:hypothetical protein
VGVADQWYEYRDSAIRRIAIDWCEVNKTSVTPMRRLEVATGGRLGKYGDAKRKAQIRKNRPTTFNRANYAQLLNQVKPRMREGKNGVRS